MNKEKISSQEIIDLVASKASVSKRAAEEFLKVMIASIEEGLLAGESVKIKSFGTFKLQWNEPRKSVNIQTKEEILLNGYYKVVFVPDNTLKEQINEPFAHLEPVELDTDPSKNELIEETDPATDPRRLFNEQAVEIKNLISEIQALSRKPATFIQEEIPVHEELTDQNSQIPDYKIENTEYDTEIDEEIANPENSFEEKTSGQEPSPVKATENNEIKIADENIPEAGLAAESLNDTKNEDKSTLKEEDKPVTPDFISNPNYISNPDYISSPIDLVEEKNIEIKEITPENKDSKLISELASTPFLENVKPLKKRKLLKWVLLILFLVIGSGTGVFIYYASSGENSGSNIAQQVSISQIANTITDWITPAPKPTPKPIKVVIPKDTTVYAVKEPVQPVDSVQLLFDNPRVYTEYIASERIKEGSRLTIMSRKYFKSKDFWVYIYEANKEKISNPDEIAIGTLIRIPKLDPRLIDITNPRCMLKAKELHDIYVN
jgi:nucleoid DNA-binding protein